MTFCCLYSGPSLGFPECTQDVLSGFSTRTAARSSADQQAEGRRQPRTAPSCVPRLVRGGIAAGAGVDDHLHLHIVPRWTGDTNFMPVLGRTRLLSEGLQTLYEKLMDGQSHLAS